MVELLSECASELLGSFLELEEDVKGAGFTVHHEELRFHCKLLKP
jgi:hypothetical protein